MAGVGGRSLAVLGMTSHRLSFRPEGEILGGADGLAGKIPHWVRDDRLWALSFRSEGVIFHAHVDGGWPLGLLHAESDRTQPPPPRGRAVAMTFDIWSTKRRSGKLQPCVGRGLGIRGVSLVSCKKSMEVSMQHIPELQITAIFQLLK